VEEVMPIKDLIPWNRGRSDLAVRRNDEATNPFLMLHREMNRLFDDAFRGFDVAFPSLGDRQFSGGLSWPHLEVSEHSNEVKVTAELPGLEEKDVDIHLADGVLTISGEKRPRRRTRTAYSPSATTVGSNAASRLKTLMSTR
jgi:HSP20 family protein